MTLMESIRYWASKCRSRRAFVRALWWRLIRRYPCEICHSCGRPVGHSCPSWWWAPEALWAEVVDPDGGGIRCIPCFTGECREHGVSVSWTPQVEARKVDGRWVETDAASLVRIAARVAWLLSEELDTEVDDCE